MLHLEYLILALVVIAAACMVAGAVLETAEELTKNLKGNNGVTMLTERIDNLTAGVDAQEGNVTEFNRNSE